MLILQIVLGLLVCANVVYALLTLSAARLWHRARRPLNPDWTPGVTILKPVRGADAEAYDNFVSFCRQDYPADRFQLLFGALDADDTALVLACRLKAEFPHLDIEIAGGSPESLLGHNRKVSNMARMLPHARHDLLVLCDSDMRVQPDYLRRIVAPFDPEYAANATEAPASGSPDRHPTPDTPHPVPPVGLVTCPYRGHHALSFAAKLEALGIGADFIPSAFVSRMLEGVGFAFGSTIALPRSVLDRIGGFEAIADELADDFRLGQGAAQNGYQVVLSDYVVDDVLGREKLGAMWTRRLRWARTVRACRPAGYAGSFVTHGTVLALLFLAATRFSVAGWLVLGAVLAVRMAVAGWIGLRYTEDADLIRSLPLLPVSDLLSFALYVASYCGRHILWRGERFRLLPGGRIRRVTKQNAGDC